MPQAKKKTSAKKKTVTKLVKKSAPKVAAKKVTKKVAKKAVAKTVVKKKTVAKKVTKKAATPVVVKKSPKKAAPKPPVKTAKAVAPKVVAPKVATPKIVAPKAVASKPAAKKVAAKPAVKAAPAKAAAPVAKALEVKPVAAKSKPVKAAAPAPKAKARPSNVATTERVAGGLTPYEIKSNEEFMNEAQVAHFRAILNAWKRELMEEVDRTVHHMQDDAANFPDPSDRATQESEFSLELRARDRERKLIKKIDESLQALDNHEYGYCETCGVEIGIRRLEARPTATLCIDCKTLDEIREKQRA